MPILDRIEAAGRDAWLRAVAWANKLFASLFAAISAAYAAYPDSVKGFLKQVPEWAVFPAAIAVFLFINHALKRAKAADK
jgi:hypothetical protein